MKRFLFGQKYDEQMSILVFMKSESQEWTDFTYLDGSSNLQSVTSEAAKNINISYDPDKNAVLLSSLEANENFWGLYRFLIEEHFGLTHIAESVRLHFLKITKFCVFGG